MVNFVVIPTVLTLWMVAAAASTSGPAPLGPGCDQAVELFPKGAPYEVPGTVGPEVWDPAGGELHVLNVTRPTITYRCANRSNPNFRGGSVVVAPGGGYHDLAYDKEGTDVAAAFNKMGLDAFVLKYRVPARPQNDSLPKWWAPLQDAQRAVAYIRHNAGDPKGPYPDLNGSAIGFMGFSAGGHLTAHISTAWTHVYPPMDEADAASSRPDFSLPVYPWYIIEDNKPTSTSMATEITITKDTPPAFVCANEDDPTAPVANSLQYYLHTHLAGVARSRLLINPVGGHGFGLCQTFSEYQECCSWTDSAQLWLQDIGIVGGFPKNP